jgi:uncharacterized protein YbcI
LDGAVCDVRVSPDTPPETQLKGLESMEDPRDRSSPVDPIERSEREAGPPPTEIADAIAAELLHIHRESYGRAAERATSHLVGDTLIVILDGLELLPNEEFLVENGRDDVVEQLRTQYQRAIEPTFRAAVERALRRRVVAFSSHAHLDQPRYAVEIFRLAPE